MQTYRYARTIFDRLQTRAGLVVLLLLIPLAFGLGWALGGGWLAGLGWGLLVALLVCLGIYALNLRSVVTLDADRLSVDFMGRAIAVPWEGIQGVRQVYGLPRKAWLVRAAKISFLHKFYGLQFDSSWTPGFLIWEDIGGRVELLAEIRKKIKALH